MTFPENRGRSPLLRRLRLNEHPQLGDRHAAEAIVDGLVVQALQGLARPLVAVAVGAGRLLDDVDADLNDDGVVDILDLLIWLTCKGSISQECLAIADIDGNGSIDVNDLFLLLANWGPCP